MPRPSRVFSPVNLSVTGGYPRFAVLTRSIAIPRSWDVKRVLLDDGSNIDAIFSHLLRNLGISKGELNTVKSPTFEVGPSELPVLGYIDLPLMLKGTSP